MTYICSIGTGIPPYEISQNDIKPLIKDIFSLTDRETAKLFPVFDNTLVKKRQFAAEPSWFKNSHTFKESNYLYQQSATNLSLAAIDECLANKDFLSRNIPHEAIDMIVYVSSTGLSTPSIDAFLMNERPFKESIQRMPLWGLGCAGGAIGLSRVHDFITANPDKTALIVCCELCSLTFQKSDRKKSNMVGTALFGDGVAAAVAVGRDSPLRSFSRNNIPEIRKTSSCTKKHTLEVMGWDITDNGMEVVFSKSIPALIGSFWKEHISNFLEENLLYQETLHSFIAHPGGRKVLEEMEKVLHASRNKFKHSYTVLADHGNMSSATVLYVLKAWMKEVVEKNEKSILSAMGPGFSSELMLIEWGKG
ncbi:type III polyketide synthase [Virgibacillus kimchii]